MSALVDDYHHLRARSTSGRAVDESLWRNKLMRPVIIFALWAFLLPGTVSMMAQCQDRHSAKADSSSSAPSKNMNDKDQPAGQFDCLPDGIALKDVVTYRGDAN